MMHFKNIIFFCPHNAIWQMREWKNGEVNNLSKNKQPGSSQTEIHIQNYLISQFKLNCN